MPKTPEPTGFWKRLKQVRMKAGLTQRELADKIGFNRATISHLERGTQEPTWSTVIKLAEALDVSVAEFVVPQSRRMARPGEAKRGRPSKKKRLQ